MFIKDLIHYDNFKIIGNTPTGIKRIKCYSKATGIPIKYTFMEDKKCK